jgi:hypothetical protein
LRVYSYIIDHDLGFAPNPFHGVCTLATCKPQIRKYAKLGDIIVGTGSIPNGIEGRLTYFMKVSRILSFDEYWSNPTYRAKRPTMNGSRMQQYGDNIYSRDPLSNQWRQADSFHSEEGGVLSEPNLKRDTSTTDRVLIGEEFAYWGAEGPRVPDELSDFVHSTQGHRCRYPAERVKAVVAWLEALPPPQFVGRPANWPAPGA